MPVQVRLGMLTPSSNTVLEPVTTALLAGLPEVSVHFSRFRVTEIALTERALGQFDDSEILRAAELLAHARVDAIGWSGTCASWLGFEAEMGLPVYDSVAAVTWKALCLAGVVPSRLQAHGRLFGARS